MIFPQRLINLLKTFEFPFFLPEFKTLHNSSSLTFCLKNPVYLKRIVTFTNKSHVVCLYCRDTLSLPNPL